MYTTLQTVQCGMCIDYNPLKIYDRFIFDYIQWIICGSKTL